MAPMKRPAAASSGSAAKKSNDSSLSEQLKKVVTALKGAESYPAHVINMLSENLHLSLGEAKEGRHGFQEKINSMIAEVLGSVQTAAEKKVADAATRLAEAEAIKASREAEEASAKNAAEGAKQSVEAAEKELDTCAAELKARSEELKAAKKEQDAGAAKLLGDESMQAKLEQIVATAFNPCKEGSLEAGSSKSRIAEVCKLGKELELDAAMIHSLPSALGKAPSVRGSFDELVVKQMETQLLEHQAKFTAQLQEGAVVRQAHDDKVAAAQAAVDAAIATKKSKEESLKTAQEAEKAAMKAAQEASKALKKFGKDMKKMDADLAETKQAIEDILAGPMTSFKSLLERSSVIPEAPVAKETVAPAEESVAPTA
eukprot:TRINITY_DN26686_c0_g1_i1.p1 TRINITY_DN26686_c0_g1~~TRINITY_DN26686_c0_g1_i1.p1  ORF type:complete len:372 (+),score=137.23 TRINITY_DN26686_c0_g1_i1:68-1183(+)